MKFTDIKYSDGSSIPRRSFIDRNTPAELAIRNAMGAVDQAGAHPLLTDAVVILQQGFDKLADYVDQQIENKYGGSVAALINDDATAFLASLPDDARHGVIMAVLATQVQTAQPVEATVAATTDKFTQMGEIMGKLVDAQVSAKSANFTVQAPV